jgi:hypothetical protein
MRAAPGLETAAGAATGDQMERNTVEGHRDTGGQVPEAAALVAWAAATNGWTSRRSLPGCQVHPGLRRGGQAARRQAEVGPKAIPDMKPRTAPRNRAARIFQEERMTVSTVPYTIGDRVSCTDGECGALVRVIIDPVSRTLAHLVVEPADPPVTARLVPVDLIDPHASTITLTCDLAGFVALDSAGENRFLPAESDMLGYAAGQTRWLPYYPMSGVLGSTAVGAVGWASEPGAHGGPQPRLVTYERVPAGEIQVHRGERVHAVDGEIGRVRGLVVDPRDQHLTHVLLDEGHLWGKKEVAIPFTAVTAVNAGGIALSLAKDEVRDLPPVQIGPRG